MNCWRCKSDNWLVLQYGTMNEPLKRDKKARYCGTCSAINPNDAAKCKPKKQNYERRRR